MLEDPTKGEDNTKDPDGGEGQDPKTPSGSSTANRSKYDADIHRRDKTIAELKKQLAELTEGKAAAGDETCSSHM